MADNKVHLRWTGAGNEFIGGAEGGPEVTIDGGRATGPSPMDALLLSVAGCMGIDVLMILEKQRVPVDGLSVSVDGHRAEGAPRRFTSLRLDYEISGPGPEHDDKIERAIELSKDRYCSVLHTLRTDLAIEIGYRRV